VWAAFGTVGSAAGASTSIITTTGWAVNHVQSFWRLFKKAVASTHIHVSPKYMDRYLREFTFRSNHRAMQNAMFDLLVGPV
jgi:ISXO2-like transposase domain